MNYSLKRILLAVATLNLLLAAFVLPKSFGQNFSNAKVFEGEDAKVVVPNFSEDSQFPVGGCDTTGGILKWLEGNKASVKGFVSDADKVVVFGLQDEIDDFQRGLGECRANKVAQLVNEWVWNDLFDTVKITAQGYQLRNDPKTKVLEKHQKYLNQRGIAIVAYHDSDFWWPLWLLLAIGGLALIALFLHLFGWRSSSTRLSDRDSESNGSKRNNGDSAKGKRRVSRSPNAGKPNDDENEGNCLPPAFTPSPADSKSTEKTQRSRAEDGGDTNITVNVYEIHHGDHHING